MKKTEEGISCEAGPVMIGPENPLYSVDGVTNGVIVKGNMLGDVTFLGAGAGMLPTASSVVADIIVEATHLNVNVPTEMKPEKINLLDSSNEEKHFFVRASKDGLKKIRESVEVEATVTIDSDPDEVGIVTAICRRSDIPDGSFIQNIIAMK